MKYKGIHREVKIMDACAKKLLTSVVAILLVASALMGFVMIGRVAAQPPNCPLDEDFSGSWPPSGWTQEAGWTQGSSHEAGGTPPEACLYWYNISGNYSYLDSKPVDTTGASSLTLEFKSFIIHGRDDFYCRVYTRADGDHSWRDVTPWGNPISSLIGPDTYSVDISPDIGSATQVRFRFDGGYMHINCWYVDDVKICTQAPVGGEAYPVNKISLLSPWIAVGLVVAGGTSWCVSRRRRAQS
jgi:hypothetical protein